METGYVTYTHNISSWGAEEEESPCFQHSQYCIVRVQSHKKIKQSEYRDIRGKYKTFLKLASNLKDFSLLLLERNIWYNSLKYQDLDDLLFSGRL